MRSSFSLQRLSVRPDGKVCYRLKRPWPTAGGATELVLDPLDFLRRLARLIPAPRVNLVRYGGAFSPNSALRDRIIPRLPKPHSTCGHARSAEDSCDKTSDAPDSPPAAEVAAEQVGASAVLSASAADQDELLPSALLGLPPSPEQQLELRDRYLDWASLLKRVHGEDVLVCPNCGHRPLRIIAAIDDPPLVEKILAHLGLPSERPPIAPARSPPQLELAEDYEDYGDFDFDVSESELDVD